MSWNIFTGKLNSNLDYLAGNQKFDDATNILMWINAIAGCCFYVLWVAKVQGSIAIPIGFVTAWFLLWLKGFFGDNNFSLCVAIVSSTLETLCMYYFMTLHHSM
jgi:hypothetical protein